MYNKLMRNKKKFMTLADECQGTNHQPPVELGVGERPLEWAEITLCGWSLIYEFEL
jgi:hypothetical protein